ncbi:MAG TPA: zinc-dependent metalloprotease [Acidimicrobiales bacterium]|nr:zinc-dependent metalloprotease [Acidimicrobiales bacterium]
MSDLPTPGGGGDFFAKMLGDLLRLMPQGSGYQWQLAYQLAASAAAGDSPDPNPDPRERIHLEELSKIAELHVADVTGMQLTPSGRSPRLVPTSKSEWARRTLDTWRPVLDRLSPAPLAPPPPTEEETGEEGRQLSELLSRWAGAAMPMMIAMQVGSAVGHLAQRALGQYEVPLAPAAGDEILVVAANLAEVASDWSLPADDLSLWLCAHEMAHHAVLSRPHVAQRLSELVVAHAETVRPDPDAFQSLLSGGDLTDLSSIMELFGDPTALQASLESPEVQRVRAELDALVATISGYAEHVTSEVANRLIGTHAPIGEAMRRRRLGRGAGEEVAEGLFGLRLDQDNVDRGDRFVEGVLERSGGAELARLWVDASSLPTPSEVDAPGLWLARLEIA